VACKRVLLNENYVVIPHSDIEGNLRPESFESQPDIGKFESNHGSPTRFHSL